MEWTDEALKAAWDAFRTDDVMLGDRPRMRNTLDAAVKAQENACIQLEIIDGATYRQVRAEALEEAAKVLLEKCHDDMTREEEAAAIRALKTA